MCVNHFHKNVEYFSILCYIEIKEVRKMLQLYKNIKKRRLELQLTQTDLATKLGYADKSMIAKIEKGLVDLPQSKILAFADVLQTSPSDLMGWEQIDTNFSGKEAPKEIYDKFKSNVSKELPDIYGKLSSPNQKRVLTYSRNLLMNQQMEEDLTVQAAHERTDIEVTDEMRQHDDDIMDDENF